MLDTPKHKATMYGIVMDIFTSPIAEKLAFKGGTLAFFHYGLDRFSTDIDIDVIDGKISDEIKETIENILLKYGKTKKDYENQISMRYKLSYGEKDLNVKVELNTRIRKNNKYEIINFRGISIRAMEKSTIFANKLFAFINRQEMVMRDLRDIHFFFQKGFPINEEVILERLKIKDIKGIKTFKDFIKYLRNILSKDIKPTHIVDANLGIVLSDTQKQRARTQLIPRTIAYLDFLLESK